MGVSNVVASPAGYTGAAAGAAAGAAGALAGWAISSISKKVRSVKALSFYIR